MTLETTATAGELVQMPVVTGGDLPGLAVLQQWAEANDFATRLVAQWIWTDLVPLHHWPQPAGVSRKEWPNPRLKHPRESDEDYRRRAEIATASAAGTVLRGIPLGLSPNVALEQMHSIHGTIGMKTKLKYALAVERGAKVWDVLLSEEKVICAGILPTTGEVIEIPVTMAQAKKAGWTENAAYGKTPIDLLWARSMSRVLDRVAGHILFGLASIEDIDGTPDDAGGPVVTSVTAQDIKARAATVTAAAAIPPAAASPDPEPAPDEAPAGDPPAPAAPAVTPMETGEQITMAQSRKLAGLLRSLDLDLTKEADAARHVIGFIAEREVDHPKYLTTAEAGRVIRRLEELAARPEPKWRAEIRFILTGLEAGQPEDAGQLPVDGGDGRG